MTSAAAKSIRLTWGLPAGHLRDFVAIASPPLASQAVDQRAPGW
jgi:hypothetical protein